MPSTSLTLLLSALLELSALVRSAAQAKGTAAAVVSIDQKARERHPATGDTLAARVLALFQSNPSEEFSPSDVADELGDATYGGVSGTIATLVRNGQVLRIGRGKYTAAS